MWAFIPVRGRERADREESLDREMEWAGAWFSILNWGKEMERIAFTVVMGCLDSAFTVVMGELCVVYCCVG